MFNLQFLKTKFPANELNKTEMQKKEHSGGHDVNWSPLRITETHLQRF